jgi:hypothetical protein
MLAFGCSTSPSKASKPLLSIGFSGTFYPP